MKTHELHWFLAFLLGALFVTVNAANRLSGPAADRSYTTYQRYAVGAAYYAIGYLATYYLLTILASYAVNALALHSNASSVVTVSSVVAVLLDSPPWIALFTLLVLPSLPYVSLVDRSFRQHARQIAGIPAEALKLRKAIREARYIIPEEDAKDISFSVLRRGLDLGNWHAIPDRTLHSMFSNASELKYFLDRLGKIRQYSGFFSDNARSFYDLTRRFDLLWFKASRTVDAVGELNNLVDTASGRSGNWESLGSLLEGEVYDSKPSVLNPATSTTRVLLNNLRDDMRIFIDDSALLLARITLRYGRSPKAREALLHSLGIWVDSIERPAFHSLLPTFVIVLAAMVISATVFHTTANEQESVLGLMLLVPTMFLIALFCAVYPKKYFSFANVDVYGRSPYLFYISAGLLAVFLTFVVGLAFRAVILQDSDMAIRVELEKSPYLFIMFAVASTLAVLVQDKALLSKSIVGVPRRWLDALVMGLSLSIASVIAQNLLPHTQLRMSPTPPIGPALLLSLGVGGFVGYTIPYRFRSAGKRSTTMEPMLLEEVLVPTTIDDPDS